MKIRTDFVTNSSSSSYVIAFDGGTFDKANPFVRIAHKFLVGNGNLITSKNELDEWIIKEYCWREANTLEKLFEEEPYRKELYDRMEEEINKNRFVLCREIDYHDETITNVLYELEKEGLVTIIEGD